MDINPDTDLNGRNPNRARNPHRTLFVGVFEPQCLQVKESNGTIRAESATGRTFTDGSVECDLPMAQLSELFNINHFIVSQVSGPWRVGPRHPASYVTA